MLNVYDGTLGFTIRAEDLTKKLMKLYIEHGSTMSYELPDTDKVKYMCLTGVYCRDEDIQPFYHPFLFMYKDSTVIAGDFRHMVKSNVSTETVNISDVLQDRYNGRMLLYRMLFTGLLIEDPNSFSNINNQLAMMFSEVLSNTISLLVFNKEILPVLKAITNLHYRFMDEDRVTGSVLDHIPIMLLRNIREHTPNYISKLSEIKLPSKTIGDLLNNIKTVIDDRRVQALDSDMLIQSLSRTFYSTNSKELALAMVENRPTFMSILYMVETEGINSKSIFRKIIESKKRIINVKETIRILDKIIKDNLVLV